ncbi:MAG: DUF1326 domain-containing protein [Candidatus Rokubacteria bacterium]|nr:DUF1326 domain-containing protein [Candidatus Rokubacteria bacterium]MBI2016823.1 DUF1326 domain-containing protein [Candidatus Rokubacteria bacterium]MBI2491814.1 DUF1326 domain-containing protein [Candidatus Rokubacteria bacterium]MBI4628459.1 DUF1326 domain-containing protein [Candidatus Rokubacteria bacterium]
MAEPWFIRGEYMESCNCEVLCPCLLGSRDERGSALARPTEGYCDVPMVFQIHDGHYGKVRLNGTLVGLAIHTPGPMGLGDWTFALYLDERAAPEQREASEKIFSGQSGGAVGRFFGPLIKTRLPTRVVAMELGREGRRGWARIPGVLEVEYEGIPGLDGSASWLDNLRHFVSRRLYTCRSTRSVFRDHGFDWNHAGRNAYYASFEWSGP